MPCRHCGCRGLAKIAWSCADVEWNLSSGRELPMRERSNAASERMEAGTNACRVAWRVDRWKSGAVNDILGRTGRLFVGSATSSQAATERPLLEVVTVVSRGTNILERSCVPPAGL